MNHHWLMPSMLMLNLVTTWSVYRRQLKLPQPSILVSLHLNDRGAKSPDFNSKQ